MAKNPSYKGFYSTEAVDKIVSEHAKKFYDSNQSKAIRDLIVRGSNNNQSTS